MKTESRRYVSKDEFYLWMAGAYLMMMVITWHNTTQTNPLVLAVVIIQIVICAALFARERAMVRRGAGLGESDQTSNR